MNVKLKWARFILFIAALYNVFWGIVISLYPQLILFGNAPTSYMLILIRCIGMLVGVYGIAYYFSSTDPERYWPLILVGLIGKILGPIGAAYYVLLGTIKPDFLIVNVFNDLIWLFPFSWVLYQVLTGKLSGLKIVNDGKTLYQKFIGEQFDMLSSNLQHFHQSKSTVRVAGRFKVSRGTNVISELFAKLADLPQESDSAEAELIVQPSANEETWSRRIGDKKVISIQWLDNKFLVEKFKMVRIYLTAQVIDGDLIIDDAVSTIFGFPMPPFFTPAVHATGKDVGHGIAIDVEISFKPFGLIINYCGIVSPEAT